MYVHLIVLAVVLKGCWSQAQYVAINNGYRYVANNNPFPLLHNNRPIGYLDPFYPRQTHWNPFFRYRNSRRTTTPAPNPFPTWLRIFQAYSLSTLLNRLFNRPQPVPSQLPETTTATRTSPSPTLTPNIASSPTTIPGWSEWSGWSVCNEGQCGTQYRTRQCIGGPCGGLGVAKRDCNKVEPCPLRGIWGSWESFGSCSELCGTPGEQEHRRTCLSGDGLCEGEYQKTEACNENNVLEGGICYDVVFALDVTSSQAEVICSSSEGTNTEFMTLPNPSHMNTVVIKMKSLRPGGLKIWVANKYIPGETLTDYAGSIVWFGSSLPMPTPVGLESQPVMLVANLNDQGFDPDPVGTATADGVLCGEDLRVV